MAAWMLYALAIGAGLSLTALAAEHALRLLGAPRRWGWAVALGASVLAPVALPLRSLLDAARALPEAPSVATVRFLDAVQPVAAPAPAPRVEPGIDWSAAIDALLAWGWLAASLAGVAILLGSAASLGRVRGRWRQGRVAGVPVLLSRTAGPAVVGCFRPTIVIPEWVLALPPEQQRLIVAHEREHRWARDPLLIAAALAAVVLMPWNPALWWQLSRLRLAIEVDCDRRVLASAGDLKRYGELLLEIGRRSRRNWLPAAAFSEPASFLERRIHAMTFHAPRDRALRAAALLVLVVAAPAALSAAPVVSHPALARLAQRLAAPRAEAPARALAPAGAVEEIRQEALRAARAPAEFRVVALAADPLARQGPADSVPDGIGGYAYRVAPLDRVPELSNKGVIASIMARLYPRLLKDAGIGGTVVVQYVVEPDGTPNMRTARLVENSHPDLVEATFKALERFRFRPGRIGDRNVRVVIQMPISWDPAARADTTVALAAPVEAGSRTVYGTPVVATGYASVARSVGQGTLAEATESRRRESAAELLRDQLAVVQGTATAAERNAHARDILDRAKILIAQRYPSLLTETQRGTASLFVLVGPDGAVRDSWLVRTGEPFSWPEGTPTNFKRVSTFRGEYVVDFAPPLIGTGIVWAEL